MCFLHDMSSKPVAGGGIWKGCRPMVLGAGESSVTAWHGLSILSDLRLQGSCANGLGTSLAPRVPDKRADFLWVPKVTGSILSGCVLLGMGSNPAAVRVFRNRSKGLAPMVSEPASHRGCRTKALFLFFMGSKGNGKHFVGLRFAWHGLESCCCSGVSEPASKRLAPMVSELRPQLGCRTNALVFIGSKGKGKHFVGPGFAWHGLRRSRISASKGLAPINGLGTSLAPRVPDKRTVFYGFQK